MSFYDVLKLLFILSPYFSFLYFTIRHYLDS